MGLVLVLRHSVENRSIDSNQILLSYWNVVWQAQFGIFNLLLSEDNIAYILYQPEIV